MRISGYCHNSSTGIKLIILLLLILWGALIVAIPMFFVKGSNALLIAMYLQNIGMFILPAWIAATLFWGNAGKSLYLNKAPRIIELLGIIALFIVATPALNRIVEWNEAMHLPEALYNIEQWMRQQDNAATKITEQILQVNSFSHFLAVIFGIGILTGIGEEMIFRGVLQRIVQDKNHRAHVAVWICAFLFSAIHLQFYGFIPRLLLGAFFGYLLVWSKNLWLPIFAHLFNNSTVACISYFTNDKSPDNLIETVGTSGSPTSWLAGASLIGTVILLYVLYKKVFFSKSKEFFPMEDKITP